MGSFQGSLSSLPATKLGSIAIKGAIDRAGKYKYFFHEKTSHSSACYRSVSVGFNLLVKQDSSGVLFCFAFASSTSMSLFTNGI